MKFAHIADCHIGAWRDHKLRDVNSRAFVKAIDTCIKEKMDFILISGDLFNTSLPSIDILKETVTKLKELRDTDIPVYIVAGSHDFSPSGKTMLDVLENAGLFTNVVKGKVVDGKLHLSFTIDQKTGAKITGMLGKKGMLEKKYYESLDKRSIEKEEGYKIFMFHTALTELKPKELEKMDSTPVSFLPKGCDYYAGGHPHIIVEKHLEGYKRIAYPGPLFPNSFSELEKLGNGGFYIIDDDKITWQPIKIFNVCSLVLDCNGKSPEEVEQDIYSSIKGKELINTIVTLRLYGKLGSGRVSDIHFKEVSERVYEKSAYFFMKNTNKLTTREFQEVKVSKDSVEDIESVLIEENLGQLDVPGFDKKKEQDIVRKMMVMLDTEKEDGEKVIDFEQRVTETLSRLLDI